MALALFASACASSADAEADADVGVSGDAAVQSEGADIAGQVTPDGERGDDVPEEGGELDTGNGREVPNLEVEPGSPAPFEKAALRAGINTLPSLGGVQFDLPQDSRALIAENCLLIFDPDDTELGARETTVMVGRIAASRRGADLSPLNTIDKWANLVEETIGTAPVAAGETVNLFGQDLIGFDFEAIPFFGEGENMPELFNCGGGVDMPSFLEVFPSGFASWFLAETDEGLMVVVSGGATPEQADRAAELRDRILASLVRVDSPVPITREVGDEPDAELTFADFPAPDLGDRARTVTYPALGGIRFDIDNTHDVWAYGDGIVIDPVGAGGNVTTDSAQLALITQTPEGAPIDTVADFLETMSFVPEISVAPNGRVIDVFDRELTGFTVELVGIPPFATTLPEDALRLFDTSRRGSLPFASLTPQRTQMYLAETPAGVLYASYDVNPYVEDPLAQDAFATLLATVELTGPGLGVPLPEGARFGGDGPSPEAAEISDDGPPALFVSSSPIADGRYQLHNFGYPISAQLDGWFVQPNLPGAAVFVGGGISRGPGDRGVVFLAGIEPSITPQAGGPTRVGDPVDLSDIEAFLDDPPDNLDIFDVSQTEIAGLEAFRFDVRVAQGATCAQDDPCEYAFEATWNWNATVSINAENHHRIWWIPDHPAGPSMIYVSDFNEEFLDIGTSLVDSIELVE